MSDESIDYNSMGKVNDVQLPFNEQITNFEYMNVFKQEYSLFTKKKKTLKVEIFYNKC